MLTRHRSCIILLLAALVLSACQPVMAAPVAQQEQAAAMSVLDQFFAAYETYDIDKMLALQTDDVVWTWIDPGKNFPDLGPEGRLVATGKDEIQAMFEYDRSAGFGGYILWSDVQG
ncbi:MAG: nuclear transport factor 2 family protein, partial [Caldilineaceae bacterium]|nr:nuclear transport factor 2 family protein [Caldilineaceae bacterium]